MHLSVRSLAAPVYFLELVLLLLGLSLLLASAFVFYRDVGHIWEIAQLVLFYGSAIVFPFTLFVVKGTATQLTTLGTFAGLNPIAQIVEDLRHALVSPDIPSMEHLLGPLYVVPIAIVLIVFVLGYAVFRHLTPRFAESL
jgi:ABC-2 type transport system permease protein